MSAYKFCVIHKEILRDMSQERAYGFCFGMGLNVGWKMKLFVTYPILWKCCRFSTRYGDVGRNFKFVVCLTIICNSVFCRSTNLSGRKISGEMMEESSRRWEDLDTHILKKIFSFSDSPGNVLRVCHSWRLCCYDILFWEHNVLDLSPIVAALGKVDSFSGRSFRLRRLILKNVSLMEGFKHIDNKLMKLLESILYGKDVFGISLEHWRLSIRSLFIPEDLEISNQHLLYIAERYFIQDSFFILKYLD